MMVMMTDKCRGNIREMNRDYGKSTHNRRERPVCGHRGRSRGPFYYRITTFGKGPWDARDPHKTTFMALKHVIRLSIWQRQKETPGVEKAPGVSSPQRKESGRSGRDDGELRFGYDPAIHARRSLGFGVRGSYEYITGRGACAWPRASPSSLRRDGSSR